MIVIRLKAGMGNQMFQYAFAKGISAKLNTSLIIDCSLLLDRARGKDHVYRDYDLTIFKLQAPFRQNLTWLRLLFRLKSSKVGKLVRKLASSGLREEMEKHFHVDHELLENPKDNTVYNGWWQSEKYFEHVADEVRMDFTFRYDLLKVSEPLLAKIKTNNAVCLNVRRTDFLTNDVLNATNKDYFMKSVQRMSELVNEPYFFVFSDDIAWCRENIKIDFPVEIVGHEHKGIKFGNYMRLMTECQHFIIPNSSFAWWSVWLNKHKDKHVIAPKNWFNGNEYDTTDLVPDSWIRL